ncbi:MAG: hypothetical protein ABEJ59_03155 [Halanaeroarchaeum sp.]
MTAIVGLGVHVPRYRIDADALAAAPGGFGAAGIRETAVAGPDEDSLTMAVEAATRALAAADLDRERVSALAVGTTTPPLAESDLSAQVVEMLGLPRDVETAVTTQSTRAGVSALKLADALRDGPALVVAADAPEGEPDDDIGQAAGAGAVALVLADEGPATVHGTASYAREFPGTRYRERGETSTRSYGATAYERRAYRETVAGAIEALSVAPVAIAPTAPDGSMPYRATGDLSNDPDVFERASSLGDTGAASPLFGLVAAWEADATDVAVVGYGDGAAADVAVVRGTAPVRAPPGETVSLTYEEYLRYRGETVSEGGRR